MDFYSALRYFSGIHFLNAGLGGEALLRTAALVHVLDAILCGLIAGQSGRSKTIWTVAGLGLGIWALAAIFLLPAKKRE